MTFRKVERRFLGPKNDGWFLCLDNQCPYKRACANHETAGDYRSEDGFRPEILRAGPNHYIFCRSCMMPAAPEEEMTDYRPVPVNVKHLQYGGWENRDQIPVPLAPGTYLVHVPIYVSLLVQLGTEDGTQQAAKEAEQLLERIIRHSDLQVQVLSIGPSLAERRFI